MMQQLDTNCTISGLHCKVDKNCTLLGCYTLCIGNSLPTFWDNLSVPTSRVKNPRRSLCL